MSEDKSENKHRNHRELGQEMDLFSFHDIAPGAPFWHPKGMVIFKELEKLAREINERDGYLEISTPILVKKEVFEKSGHWQHYRDNMFYFTNPRDEKELLVVKPMNCPGHILIYKSKTRSYKDLPIRYFELGTVYRHEKAGVLHGLLRVRGFTQDDAHIFCLPEQLRDEIKSIIDFVFDTMKVFGFNEVGIELSTRPEKYIGSEEDWQRATQALESALKEKNLKYDVNEGDGAFYGPKIDIKLKDALKRSWQCATIQCDFALPKRFGLSFIDSEGKEKQPIMLHRVLLGSLERFIGALIEHYKGDFPLWLAPAQVLVIPIKDTVREYCAKVKQSLEDNSIRVEIDSRNETLDKRIRNAELNKIPFTLIVGEREAKQGNVSVRKRKEGDKGSVPLEKFIEEIKKQISERK